MRITLEPPVTEDCCRSLVQHLSHKINKQKEGNIQMGGGASCHTPVILALKAEGRELPVPGSWTTAWPCLKTTNNNNHPKPVKSYSPGKKWPLEISGHCWRQKWETGSPLTPCSTDAFLPDGKLFLGRSAQMNYPKIKQKEPTRWSLYWMHQASQRLFVDCVP